MGLKAVIKKGFSFGFQPKRWLGVDQVAAQGETCLKLVKDMLKPGEKPEVTEVETMTATARQKLALALWTSYLFSGVCGFVYACYLVLSKALFLPASVMFIVSLLLFVYALREFMVYGQMRCGGEALPLKALIKKLFVISKVSS